MANKFLAKPNFEAKPGGKSLQGTKPCREGSGANFNFRRDLQ
jgi:hypothetical protein